MDKKIVGLVGAVSALAMMTAVETAKARQVTEVLNARSYAELLQPIPNAASLLTAADSLNGTRGKTETESNVQLAQYYHHHHHHYHYRRYHQHHWYHHHHHHHHHY